MAVLENAPQLRSQFNEFLDFEDLYISRLDIHASVLLFFEDEVIKYINENTEGEPVDGEILLRHLQKDKTFINDEVLNEWAKKVTQTPEYLRGIEFYNFEDYLLNNIELDSED